MTTNSVFPPTRPVVQNPSKSLEICTKVRSQHCLSAMFPFSFHYFYCHIFDISMVSNKSYDILLVFIVPKLSRMVFAGDRCQNIKKSDPGWFSLQKKICFFFPPDGFSIRGVVKSRVISTESPLATISK